MLEREELQGTARDAATEAWSELETVRRQLAAARAKNLMWRSLIERHLEKGCPSESRRALLAADDRPDEFL
jgi:hypothetical protein